MQVLQASYLSATILAHRGNLIPENKARVIQVLEELRGVCWQDFEQKAS
jgi:hypothetical protein